MSSCQCGGDGLGGDFVGDGDAVGVGSCCTNRGLLKKGEHELEKWGLIYRVLFINFFLLKRYRVLNFLLPTFCDIKVLILIFGFFL